MSATIASCELRSPTASVDGSLSISLMIDGVEYRASCAVSKDARAEPIKITIKPSST